MLKNTRTAFAVLSAFLFASLLNGDVPADVQRMQSAPKPKPVFVGAMVDQGVNDQRLKGYFTPEGFRLEIVSSYPQVVNPVGMTFDDEGSPLVLEWVVYGGNAWNEVPEIFHHRDGVRKVATMKKPVPDLVKRLSSTKNNGLYDQSAEIFKDELPSSILAYDEWVTQVAPGEKPHFRKWIYVSGRGSIRRYRQSKPGGPYDIQEKIATGFCGFHHHQVSGMTIGHDGMLYITSGDDDNFVQGSDGSLASVQRTGAIFRSRLDGSKMETFAIGFRNPYRDVAFDSNYDIFHVDNDNEDGSKFTGCRLMHAPEGADFGWRLRQGARCCVPDTVRGAALGELPGKMPAMLKTGRGAPAGLLIYNDNYLPEPYRGILYYPDVFRKNIRGYRVKPQGATFEVTEEFELLKSEDSLFRPNQMVTGPDGAIYIVDWRTDSGGAGRLSGDGTDGRIYRLSWSGIPGDAKTGKAAVPAIPLRGMDSWAKIRTLSDDALLSTLSGPNQTDRDRARRECARRGLFEKLTGVATNVEKPQVARLAAIGALYAGWNPTIEKAMLGLLADKSPEVRRHAADALGRNSAPKSAEIHRALAGRLSDSDVKVRRQVALSIARVQADNAADAIREAFQGLTEKEANDPYLLDGYVRAFENLGKPGVQKLSALVTSKDSALRARGVRAFLGLRTRSGVDALPQLIDNAGLEPAHRAALVKSYTNYLLEPAVNPLVHLLGHFKKHPNDTPEVKQAALEVLSATSSLVGEDARLFVLELLADPDRSTAIAAARAIEASHMKGAGKGLAERFKRDQDFRLRVAILKAIRNVEEGATSGILPQLQPVIEAKLELELRVEAFRTLLRFAPAEARKLSPTLLKEKNVSVQSEMIAVLGGDKEGATLVAAMFLENEIPRELLAQVVNALKAHTGKDKSLEATLKQVLNRGFLVANDPKSIADIRDKVANHGNPDRGRVLFLSPQLECRKCHKMEGIGGSIGPDITRLWDTSSTEKIVEAILDPSKEIKEGYDMYVATTNDDRKVQGLKITDNAKEVVLKDENGVEQRISKDNLAELRKSKVSIMPENTVSGLNSYDEFIDLLAFLKSKSAQESLRTRALTFLVSGPFDEDPNAQHGPETDLNPKAVFESKAANRRVGWAKVSTKPNGFLDLGAVFEKRENISGYALTYVYSPKVQTVQLLAGSDDGLRIWVNGVKVHTVLAARGPTEDSDKVDVPLKAGWNSVLVRVFNGTLGHGLFLRFDRGEGLQVDPTQGK